MAGPCLSVLVAKHDSDNVQRIHESAIDLVSSSREGDNFWVTDTSPINGKCRAGGQPYFSNVLTVNVDDELSDFNKSEVDQIATIMGAQPKFEISMCAMCNSDIDHRILSEVMIYLCNQLHGLLVYDGLICALLPRGMQGKDHDKAVKMATESLANLPGDIDPIYHDPNDRDAGAMHVSDTTFLESWLEHPQFRLPK